MSYHPASDEVHVTLEIPSGTADRASGVEVVADVFATMRDGVRLGADVYVPGRRSAALPAIRSASRTASGRPRWGWTRSAASSPARATPASCRTCAASSRPAARSTPACTRSRTATTPSTGSIEQDVVRRPRRALGRVVLRRSRRWPRRSAGIRRSPASRRATSASTAARRWFRQGALLLNTTGYWAMAMDAQEYADVSARRPVHLPLARHARDGRGSRRVLPRARRPRGRRGLVGAPRAAPPARRCACAGALVAGLVRRLHRAAAAPTHAR